MTRRQTPPRAVSSAILLTLFVAMVSVAAMAVTALDIEATSVEQDNTGRVWAIARPDKEYARLCTWEGDAWRPIGFSPPIDPNSGSNPMGLDPMPDGWVLCRWLVGSDAHLVLSRHRDTTSEIILSAKTGIEGTARVVLDGEGRAWVTARRAVWRVNADGAVAQVREFEPGDYHPGLKPEDEKPSYGTPSLLCDAEGRVWCWGRAQTYSSYASTIRGLWRLTDEGFERHDIIEGLPDKPFGELTQKDEKSFWLSIPDDGLYEMDIAAFRGTRVPDPEPGAFRYVDQIEHIGDDWYVVASGQRSLRSSRHNAGALWRLKDGQWQRLLSGLDYLEKRPMLQTPEGLWVGTCGQGLWMLPAAGDPVHVDWRRGLPLTRVDRVFRLPEGQLLACCTRYDIQRAAWARGGDEYLSDPINIAPNVEVITAQCGLAQDDQGQLWAVLSDTPDSLSMWDGAQWTRHALPPGFDSEALSQLFIDTRSRLWLWSFKVEGFFYHGLQEGPVAIFDPKASNWDSFESFTKALEAQRGPAAVGLFKTDTRPPAAFSEDGRIAFWIPGYSQTFYYFDGGKWQTLDHEVVGEGRVEDVFFSEETRLLVNTNLWTDNGRQLATWELDPAQGWREIARVEPPSSTTDKAIRQVLARFPDPRPESSNAVVKDCYGMWWHWYVENGQLYKRSYDLAAPQFAPNERHPFVAVKGVQRVFLDPAGNAFMCVQFYDPATYVLGKPRSPQPDTQITVSLNALDTVTATLLCAPAEAGWFVWRLDGGAWSKPQKEAQVLLASLPGGPHTLEAYALDAWLQVDSLPASATFQVTTNPEQQVTDLITALGSPDFAKREAAVQALVRHGDRALTALRNARATANDDVRWWIDAAIQTVERGSKTPTAPVD